MELTGAVLSRLNGVSWEMAEPELKGMFYSSLEVERYRERPKELLVFTWLVCSYCTLA